MPTLYVIIASTRPGRVGLPIARWFHDRATKHGAFDVELVDLAEWNLPMLDEPNHPRMRRYEGQHTLDWSAKIDAADAFVLVMPEYNYGYTAPLKNALDYLHNEWQYKPVGLVSYGGVAAGTRAVQQLKTVLSALKMVPLSEAVAIPFFATLLSADGSEIQPTDSMETAATVLLDELARWAPALKPLRAAPPAQSK